MGAMVVELRARRLSVMESGIGGLIVINLIFSFSLSNISVGSHVGGLIGGALAGFALRAAGDRYKLLGLLACLALMALSVAGAIAVAGVSGQGFA
jgi:membrane associated rhomboid family serine protease